MSFVVAVQTIAMVLISLSAATAADRLANALRPVEQHGWPDFLDRLGLPRDRAYAVVMQAPTRRAIDFQTSQSALRSLSDNAGNLLSLFTSKTQIGHAMVAWQCASGRGLASMTGDVRNQAMTMVLRDGWGVTPMLSVYNDGRIDGSDSLPFGVVAMIDGGHGNVMAVEVTEADCQSLREFVAVYISHPAHPARRYGLLLRPELFEGSGCISFALEVAGRAGVFDGARSIFKRTVEVPRSIIGRRHSAPDGVEPFAQAAGGAGQRIVDPLELVDGPWDSEAGHISVTLVDPELLFAAITKLRHTVGADEDWRRERALSTADPAVARAVERAERWASRYPHRRIADPNGTSALVLERG